MPSAWKPLRTRVYVDGYNLYYGRLKRTDLLEPIFTEAKRVRRSAGAAWKWLHTPNGHLGGRAPLSLCTDEAGAQQLRDYMAQYAREFNV